MNRKNFFAAAIMLTLLVAGLHVVYAQDGPVPVQIDIKPDSYPNVINITYGSSGVVPVAILSTPDFDATQVDPVGITLAGSGVAIRGKNDHYLASIQDVNDDGLPDLLCKIYTESLQLTPESAGAYLGGQTYDGVPIQGYDEVTVLPN